MHVILTGATGLVGSGVLDAMIKMKEITKISILSRRPVPMADDAKDPRINVIIHKDFETYDQTLLEQLKDATGCVWALGISQTKVDKESYIKITKTYTLAAAEAFQSLPSTSPASPFHFVYVSGMGATHRPGALTSLFARVKGEAELALAAAREANPRFRAVSVRPAGVDPHGHAAIAAYAPRLPWWAGLVTPGIRALAPAYASPTEPLGRFLAECAVGRWDGKFTGQKVGEFPVVENAEFRRLAGLDG